MPTSKPKRTLESAGAAQHVVRRTANTRTRMSIAGPFCKSEGSS